MPAPTSLEHPAGAKAAGVIGQGCLRGFFGIFFLAGWAVVFVAGIRPLWLTWAARDWPEVPCEILSSEVATAQGENGNLYRIEIHYRYRFNGLAHMGDRFSFAKTATSGWDGKQAVVQQYPAGSKSVCYVNPANPSEAVLHREVGGLYWYGLTGVPFILVGLLAFAPMRFYGPRSAASGPIASRRGSFPAPVAVSASGPVELAPRMSPIRRLLGILFFCVFWNSIVSVFLVMLGREYVLGKVSWVPLAFLTPFVLVGLATCGGVLYQFLALANPRLKVIAQAAAIPLGGVFDFSWSFDGHAERIRKLRIWIEGTEEATYTRGTTTSTDRSVFVSLPILETAFTEQIGSGAARATIPPGLMHSFDGGNNKIVWTLRAHGQIPRFPDVNEQYIVRVLPQSVK